MMRCRECGTRLVEAKGAGSESNGSSGTHTPSAGGSSEVLDIDAMLGAAEDSTENISSSSSSSGTQAGAYLGEDGKIRRPCPNCGRRVKVPKAAAGRTVACPFCKSKVEIPKLELIAPQGARFVADPGRSQDGLAAPGMLSGVSNATMEVAIPKELADRVAEQEGGGDSSPSGEGGGASDSEQRGVVGDDDRIRTVCGNCQRRVKAPVTLAGMEVRCPFCGESVRIPEVAGAAALDGDTDSSSAELSREETLRQLLSGVIQTALETEAPPLLKDSGSKVSLSWMTLRQKKQQVEAACAPEATRKLIEQAKPALEELSSTGDAKVGEFLLEKFEEASERIKPFLVRALGKLRHREAFEPLLKLLIEGSDSTRSAAVQALGDLGDSRAIQPLLTLLSGVPGERVRVGVAISKFGNASVPLLLGIVDSSADPAMRGIAIELLGQLKSVQAIDVLERVVRTDDASLRRLAAEALTQIPDKGVVRPLIELLKDEDPQVRALVAGGLARHPDPRAVGTLVIALDDPYFEVRINSIQALGEIGNESAVPKLLRFLADDNPQVQIASAEALGKLGNPDAVPKLLELLDARAHQPEEHRLTGKIVDALRRIRDGRAVLPLIDLLELDDRRLRQRVVEALGVIGDKSARRAIEKTLKTDESEEVRSAAAKALGDLGDNGAIPALQAALAESADVRVKAVIALGKLEAEAALPEVRQMLIDPLPQVRYQAATILGELGGADAIPSLEPLLLDSDNMVKRAAKKALEALGDTRSDAEITKSLKKSKRSRSQRNFLVDLLPTSMMGTFEAVPGGAATVLLGGTAAVVGIVVLVGMLASFTGPKTVVVRGYTASIATGAAGKLLVCGRTRGLTEIWDIGKKQFLADHERLASDFVFLSEKAKRMIGISGNAVMLYELADSGKITATTPLEGHAASVVRAAVTGDRSSVVTVGNDGLVYRWNVAQGKADAALQIPKGISAIAISPDGSLLAGGGEYGVVTVWDFDTAETVREVPAIGQKKTDRVSAVAFDTSGEVLIVGNVSGVVRLYGAAKKPTHEFTVAPFEVRMLEVTAAGELIGLDRDLWYTSSLADPKPVKIKRPLKNLSAVSVSVETGRVAIGDNEASEMVVIEAKSGQIVAELNR